MKDQFSISNLQEMNPCSEAMEWVKTQPDLKTAWENCERADWMLWFARQKGLVKKVKSVKLACAFARRVTSIFENKYPNDLRPRQAIDAALNWVKNPIEENRNAAYAAYAYAYANAAAPYAARDKVLSLAAEIAVESLQQLKSPGCEWLHLCDEVAA